MEKYSGPPYDNRGSHDRVWQSLFLSLEVVHQLLTRFVNDDVFTEVDASHVEYEEETREREQLVFASDNEERRSLFEYAKEAWEDDEYARFEAFFEEFYESPFVESQFDRERLEQLRPHAVFFDVSNVTADLAFENELSIDSAVIRIAHEESVDQAELGDTLLMPRLADDAPQSIYVDAIREYANEEPTMDELIDNETDSIVRLF